MGTPEQNRRYYEKNRERRREINDQNRAELRLKMADYLSDKSCEKCGFSNPAALQFDHKYPEHKTTEISRMLSNMCSWKRILEEISKCRILCANCHAIWTAEQRGYHWHTGYSKG